MTTANGTSNRDSRSMSVGDNADSGNEDNMIDDPSPSSAPNKPGRKKNPNSQAARRDQNRIAQREFRLRKQQRIRDLEARVEILSASKDQTYSELRNILKDLMHENQTLRGIIRSLSNFIGDGVGGLVPKLGFERPQDFIDYINKAETDTAFEGFQRRKQEGAMGSASASAPSGSSNKRSFESEPDHQSKRMRPGNGMGALDGSRGDTLDSNPFSSILPLPLSSKSPTDTYVPSTIRSMNDTVFSDLLQGQASTSGVYLPNQPADASTSYGATTSSTPQSYQSAYQQSSTPQMTAPLRSDPYMSKPTNSIQVTASVEDDEPWPEDPKLQEASRLIRYHLDNYKRNNAYCLPQSLRPTPIQRTVPHESVIDGVPHPEIRDRMILLRGHFNLVDCIHDYTRSLTLHGDDVLAHVNWELSEDFLVKYGYLVDQPVLNICNRWRRERGDRELTLADMERAADSMNGLSTLNGP